MSAVPCVLTGREIRFRKTCKSELAAQIELGKLLALAQAGRQPDSGVTVAQLLDQYLPTAGWICPTRESNLGYIRRTINPAIGSMQIRKVREPPAGHVLRPPHPVRYLACTGRPFTEHRNVPDLRSDPSDPRPEWQQAADKLRAAIETGESAPGDPLPSVPDLAQLQGLKPGTVRHMFTAPTAGALQVLVKEVWQATAPDIKAPKNCLVIRGGGEMENHFECLWDLFRSIPSLEIEGASGSCPRNAGGGALVS